MLRIGILVVWRKQMRRILGSFMVFAFVLSTALVVGSSPAGAEERRCTGRIGATTVDNVVVPSGRTCTLEGTRVKGTVKVSSGATLKVVSARIVGNIQSQGMHWFESVGRRRLAVQSSSTLADHSQLNPPR